MTEQTIFAILTALQKRCSAAIGNGLPSSSQALYPSLCRERQISFTPLLLLSPQNLRFCRDPEWQSLSAVSGRKRYNTLDFAGQNRVPKADLPALLWKPPGYRQHHFRVADRNAFCRYSFSPACCNNEKVILQRQGKMRGRAAKSSRGILVCAQCYIERFSRLWEDHVSADL